MSYERKITFTGSQNQPSRQPRPAQPESRQPAPQDQPYDDGLVHGHFWAMTTTTR